MLDRIEPKTKQANLILQYECLCFDLIQVIRRLFYIHSIKSSGVSVLCLLLAWQMTKQFTELPFPVAVITSDHQVRLDQPHALR